MDRWFAKKHIKERKKEFYIPSNVVCAESLKKYYYFENINPLK